MAYLDGRRSTFPDEIDQILELYSLPPSQKDNAQRYQYLLLKDNLSTEEQEELNQLITILQNYIIDVEKWNKFGDILINIENFFSENVQQYILDKQTEYNNYLDTKQNEINTYTDNKKQEIQAEIDKLDNKGDYNPNIQYYKNNFVTFNDGTGIKTYLCLQSCINIDPTNLTYWRVLTITGEKGEDGIGIGLTFRGAYNAGTIYAKDEAVSYGGALFGSLIDNNVGNTPDLTQDTEAWAKALDVTVTVSELKGIRTIASETSNINFITGKIIAFNPNTDTLEVRKNTTILTEGLHYSINANNQSIDNLQGTWNGTVTPIVFEFVVRRNMINNLLYSDGQSIALGTIDKTRLTTDVQDTLNEVVENTNKIGILSSLNTTDKSNLVNATNEVNTGLTNLNNTVNAHLNDYVTFKTDIGSNVKLLELNFLDLLIARELESLSTEMDTGYWWDTLQDATKIQNVTGVTVSGGKIITTAETSEVVWRVHEIGFLTDKVTYYQNRTKTTDVAPVDTGAVAGEDEITIKAAAITIAEAVS